MDKSPPLQLDLVALRKLAEAARRYITYGPAKKLREECTSETILALLDRVEADARDAARWRYARQADWDEMSAFCWSHEVQNAGTPEQCLAEFDRAIDQAIATKGATP